MMGEIVDHRGPQPEDRDLLRLKGLVPEVTLPATVRRDAEMAIVIR